MTRVDLAMLDKRRDAAMDRTLVNTWRRRRRIPRRRLVGLCSLCLAILALVIRVEVSCLAAPSSAQKANGGGGDDAQEEADDVVDRDPLFTRGARALLKDGRTRTPGTVGAFSLDAPTLSPPSVCRDDTGGAKPCHDEL